MEEGNANPAAKSISSSKGDDAELLDKSNKVTTSIILVFFFLIFAPWESSALP